MRPCDCDFYTDASASSDSPKTFSFFPFGLLHFTVCTAGQVNQFASTALSCKGCCGSIRDSSQVWRSWAIMSSQRVHTRMKEVATAPPSKLATCPGCNPELSPRKLGLAKASGVSSCNRSKDGKCMNSLLYFSKSVSLIAKENSRIYFFQGICICYFKGWGSFVNYLHLSVFSQMLCSRKTSVRENENKEQVKKATTFDGRWDKPPSSSGCSQLAAFCWGRVIICFTDPCLSISFNSHRRALLSDLSLSLSLPNARRRSWIPFSCRPIRLPQPSTSFAANGMQALSWQSSFASRPCEPQLW